MIELKINIMKEIYFFSNSFDCIYYTEFNIPKVWCDARSIDMFKNNFNIKNNYINIMVRYDKEDIPKKHLKKIMVKF